MSELVLLKGVQTKLISIFGVVRKRVPGSCGTIYRPSRKESHYDILITAIIVHRMAYIQHEKRHDQPREKDFEECDMFDSLFILISTNNYDYYHPKSQDRFWTCGWLES